MSTNLEYRETERQRKKKVGRQASEPQREKEIEREKKNKRRHFQKETCSGDLPTSQGARLNKTCT